MHDVWQASSYFTTVLLGFQYRIVDKGATCCLQVVDCGVSGNEESGEEGGCQERMAQVVDCDGQVAVGGSGMGPVCWNKMQ